MQFILTQIRLNVCYLIPYKDNESIIGNFAKFYKPIIKELKRFKLKMLLKL